MQIYNDKQKKLAQNIDPEVIKKNWQDWKWQMKHLIKDIDTFQKVTGINFSDQEKKELRETLNKFPLSVPPYYASLIKKDNYKTDPIFMQCFPSPHELDIAEHDMSDPLAEDKDSPAPGITHRYPDRVLFTISNVCAMYCRHCTRKRKVGDVDFIPNKGMIKAGVNYIRKNPNIRDVLLSGGDPLMLSNEYLDWILSEISSIPHVEMIRIGSRIPVVLPYRVTPELVDVIKKYHPVWLNTHFNHPSEITASSREALRMLANGGIPLGNQSVLLAGVNDCPRIMKSLVHKLVQNRVRPYYLYQCDLAEGLNHFRTPVGKGIEIIENLIGHTSGLAVPTYVIDAPGGGGKIPVMPNYLISWSTNKVILRNYEGVITTYKEPDSYEPVFCDRNCDKCTLYFDFEDSYEHNAIGISELLMDSEEKISLIPQSNERYNRRKGEKKQEE